MAYGHLRWLVIYETEKRRPAAKVIIDSEAKFPFGVDDEMVGEDCRSITAIVSLPDDYEPHAICVRDIEVEVQLPREEE